MQRGLFGAVYTPTAKRKPGRPPKLIAPAEDIVSLADTAGTPVSDAAGALVSPLPGASSSSAAASNLDPIVSTAQPAEAASPSQNPLVKTINKQSIKMKQTKKLKQQRKDAKRKSMRERVEKLEEQVSFLMQEVRELRGNQPKPVENQEEEQEEDEGGPKPLEFFQRMWNAWGA